MWQLITRPDILIYLNASFAFSTARAKLNWQKKDHSEQLKRLSHAHFLRACDVLKIVCDREFDMIDTRSIQFIQDRTL